MKTIVALVDFSDVALKVLREVQTLALAFKSHVTMLHGISEKKTVIDVGIASPEVSRKLTAEEVRADKARLEKLTEPLRLSGIDVSLKQFDDASVEHIVEVVLKMETDLIVVGSHQHNAFYNLIIGSVNDQILKRAKCSVLVVSADKK